MADRTLTVDRELLGALLLDVEARVHRGGWDEPAQLHVLYDDRHEETDRLFRRLMSDRYGPPARAGHYRSRSLLPREAMYGHAPTIIGAFAANLAYGQSHEPVQQMLGILCQPGLLGFASVAESWMRTAADPAEREALGNVSFADIPGSVESRFVVGVDLLGGDYAVSRQRGKKSVLAPPGVDAKLSGRFIDVLRLLVQAVTADG